VQLFARIEGTWKQLLYCIYAFEC